MILVGSQRGGALKLSAHLTNGSDNDHVEVHDLRGFSSDTLRDALQESDAIAKGTKCKQFLFSVSFNPPETARVSTADFEAAFTRVEEEFGLSDHARAVVFHEKHGRRHAHVVWSRIDVAEMKAVGLSFFGNRLKTISKDIFLEHEWRLPDGYLDREKRDPRNFDLAEWQQAKRAGKDPRMIKRVFQEAWAISDTRDAFAHALEEKGYFLARGDRRGFVALDAKGEVYVVAKWTGQKTKAVKGKLGDPKELRSVEETKDHIAQSMHPALSRWQQELIEKKQRLAEQHAAARQKLIQEQRAARTKKKAVQDARRVAETKARQKRFRSGLGGVWDRVRGEHASIRRKNEQEAWEALTRDRQETNDLIFAHLTERRDLRRAHQHERQAMRSERRDIIGDAKTFKEMRKSKSKSHIPRDGPRLDR